jgi:hypothetical protein
VRKNEVPNRFGFTGDNFAQSLIQQFVAKFASDLVERRADRLGSKAHVDRIALSLEVHIAAVRKAVRDAQKSGQGINAEVYPGDQAVAVNLEERSLHNGD